MDIVLLNSIFAALAVSVISLVGIFTFLLRDKLFKKISVYFVAFSIGALLGGAFIHLIPESVSENKNIQVFLFVLVGILLFYFTEKFLKWRHCHDGNNCNIHTFTYMSIFGDSIHNFIDGLVIVSAFCISNEIGIASTIAIASHEIPQELGDFGILIHGGFSKTKALFWNFLSAITALLGVLVGYVLVTNIQNISNYLLPIAAGGFIYIAMADLIPELHKENNIRKSITHLIIIVIGIIFMYYTKILFG